MAKATISTVPTIYNNTVENDDWMKTLPSYASEVAIHDILARKFRKENVATVTLKGGPGSGDFGHAGRPGKVGGSATITGEKDNSTYSGGVLFAKGNNRHAEAETDKENELVNRIRRYVSYHPQEVVDHIKGIEIVPDHKWNQVCDELGVNFGKVDGMVAAFYQEAKNRIYIRRSQIGYSTVLDHEIGHAAWSWSTARAVWNTAYEKENFDRHTLYSRKSSMEAFCETYSAYLAYKKSGDEVTRMNEWKSFQVVDKVLAGVK